MGRPATNISLRLRRLRQAVERAKNLPPSGWVLSSKPMAELVGMRWAAMRDWCDGIEGFEESGTFIRGGNGVEWQFNAMAALMWLVAHFESEKSGQEAESDKLAKAIGIELPANDVPSMSELKDMINSTLVVRSMKERENETVNAVKMANTFGEFLDRTVHRVMTASTRLDPNGNLSPTVRAAIDDDSRMTCLMMHSEGTKLCKELRGEDLQQGGTSS